MRLLGYNSQHSLKHILNHETESLNIKYISMPYMEIFYSNNFESLYFEGCKGIHEKINGRNIIETLTLIYIHKPMVTFI